MLRGAESSEFYVEYYATIVSSDTKHAYSFLIGWAATLQGYVCFPGSHGHIRDFRFLRGEEWDFAFIPNQRWLLFYFRRPCLGLPKYEKQEILRVFPDANETGSGEFTIKIANLGDAVRLAAYVGS